MRGSYVVAGLLAVSCAASPDESLRGYSSGSGDGAFGAPSAKDGAGSEASGSTSGSGIQAGTLTAGAWDDNLNFDFYLDYLKKTDSLAGAPVAPRSDRMSIEVTDGQGRPLAGAIVEVFEQGTVVFKTTTGADGRALFFPSFDGAKGAPLTIRATATTLVGPTAVPVGWREVMANPGPATIPVQLPGDLAGPTSALDVALVIDATGSMGDEMAYLTTELSAIAGDLATRFPGVSQRWALVFYRDEGDAFEVRSFDFRDAAAAASDLAQQKADGGGDYEELPDLALGKASELSWRSGNVARVAFHVADAPAHSQNLPRLLQSVNALRAKGVHVYPVAASGVDEATEAGMRTEAQLSGGRYLFLTNDSGVGGDHKEPTLPCFFVTKLNAAIGRMIQIELTGTYVEPPKEEILRTGGDPSDRRCTLADGRVVVAL